MDKNYDEVPKYRKKKQSGKSKSSEKSNHSHEYIDCLFVCDKEYRGSYCKICGKIREIDLFETKRIGGLYKSLTKSELISSHKGLPKIKITSIWQKYVEETS